MTITSRIYPTQVNGDDARVYWTASDVNDGEGFQAVIDRVVRVVDNRDITEFLSDDEINGLSNAIENGRVWCDPD